MSLVFTRAAMAQSASPAPQDATQPIDIKTDDEQAVAIQVQGDHQGCATSDDLFRRLRQRAPGVRLTRSGEPGWVFVARIRQSPTGSVSGQLRVHDLDGGVLLREVTGSSCAEVAEALALIGAVTIRSTTAVQGDTQVLSGAAAPAPPWPPFTAAAPDASPGWGLFVGGFGSMRSNVLPVPLYGMGLGAELAREGDTVLRPAFGLAAAATLAATANTGNIVSQTELTGQLILAQLFASPVALRAGPLELRPCATFEIGVMTSSGQGAGLAASRQSRDAWVAATLLARAEVPWSSFWRVGAHLGAEMHPIRYNFQITPFDVHRAGIVGITAGASISFRMN